MQARRRSSRNLKDLHVGQRRHAPVEGERVPTPLMLRLGDNQTVGEADAALGKMGQCIPHRSRRFEFDCTIVQHGVNNGGNILLGQSIAALEGPA